MSAGHSIAVQNFNENLSILAMLGAYALMIKADLGVNAIVVIFGLFVSASMVLVRVRHLHNQRSGDLSHLIGAEKAVPVGSANWAAFPKENARYVRTGRWHSFLCCAGCTGADLVTCGAAAATKRPAPNWRPVQP